MLGIFYAWHRAGGFQFSALLNEWPPCCTLSIHFFLAKNIPSLKLPSPKQMHTHNVNLCCNRLNTYSLMFFLNIFNIFFSECFLSHINVYLLENVVNHEGIIYTATLPIPNPHHIHAATHSQSQFRTLYIKFCSLITSSVKFLSL